MAEKKIKLAIKDTVKIKLAELGFDPQFGARPLKRLIQKMILDKLALMIVGGEIKEGTLVSLEVNGDKIDMKIK